MNDLDMTRRVTANFWFWQGLRWAPGGMVFLLIAATSQLSADWALLRWLCWTGVLAMWWYLYRLADQYYAHRFGIVVGLTGQYRRRDLIKWLVVYPAMTASIFVDLLVAPKVFLLRADLGGGSTRVPGLDRRRPKALLLRRSRPRLAHAASHFGRPGHTDDRWLLTLWAVVVGLLDLAMGTLDHLELARPSYPQHDGS